MEFPCYHYLHFRTFSFQQLNKLAFDSAIWDFMELYVLTKQVVFHWLPKLSSQLQNISLEATYYQHCDAELRLCPKNFKVWESLMYPAVYSNIPIDWEQVEKSPLLKLY